jgi:hypothetical protein
MAVARIEVLRVPAAVKSRTTAVSPVFAVLRCSAGQCRREQQHAAALYPHTLVHDHHLPVIHFTL